MYNTNCSEILEASNSWCAKSQYRDCFTFTFTINYLYFLWV